MNYSYRVRNNIIVLISIILLIVSCISTIALINGENSEYHALALIPMTFILMYFLTSYRILKSGRFSYVSIIVTLTYAVRCVIYPFFVLMSGNDYQGKRYLPVSHEELNWSIVLIAFETVFALLFVYFYDIKYARRHRYENIVKLKGSTLIYYLFIVLALVLYILIGRKYQVISFIRFNSQKGYQVIESTSLKLVRQIVVVGIALSFCLVCNYCKKKYDITGSKRFVNIAIFAAMVNTCVIVGDRRSTQLIVMLLSIIVLQGLFPNNKRRIILSIISTGVITVLFITAYRWGMTGNNRAVVLSNRAGSIADITTMLQLSYGGPDSIANGIQFGKNTGISVFNLFYDIGRSIFGLSFIFSKYGIATSNLYNLYLYSERYETGQLLFSTSYGYITLGILYPLITITNILLAYWLETWFKRTDSMEVKYMSGYCLMRIMLGSIQALPSIITVATMQVGTMGLVIFIAQLMRNSNNDRILMH